MRNTIATLKLLAAVGLFGALTTLSWAAKGGPGGTTPTTQVFDTSYAVEYSDSCLTGCHANNAALVTGYSQSAMTHVMVKCNTCHGTHTAAEIGLPKPNLTGYVAGMGATGYVVGKDRCLACHSAALNQNGHPKNPGECLSCHGPHAFPR